MISNSDSLQIELTRQFKMSYQKKSVILQELEQAIRKKAQEKSRNKEHLGRNLQASVEKKKHVLRTTNKQHKAGSIHKNQNERESRGEKHVSLFNNEGLNTMESQDFKMKKQNNRRFDKLVSLIQYMVSSSEKAIRYISSTNFQAQFALKLYRSDKQNLLNQIKNFNILDLIQSHRGHETSNQSALIQQNNKLKKDILVLQKQAQRYHKNASIQKDITTKAIQRQNSKLKQMVRKLTPFDSFRQLMDLLQKESKFDAMSIKCQQNSRKVTQIQIVISSLQNERNQMLQNLARGKSQQHTQRNYRVIQIQSQKEQLQREIGVLRGKITELKESSLLISQFELVKKNNELVHQKLNSLANWLSGHSLSPSKKHSQTIIQYIRTKTEDLLDKNEQLEKHNSKLKDRMENLQLLYDELLTDKQERDDDIAQFQKKMEKVINQLDRMKVMADQLTHERNDAVDRLTQNQRLLHNKEEQINILSAKLQTFEDREGQRQQIRLKNSQLSRQVQSLTKRLEERQRQYKQKVEMLEHENSALGDRLQYLNQQTERQKCELEEILKANESRQDDRELALEKMKIQHNLFVEQNAAKLEQAEKEVQNQRERYQKLMKTYEQSNQYYKSLTESYEQKHERVNELETILEEMQIRLQTTQQQKQKVASEKDVEVRAKITELREDIDQFRSQYNRIKKENQQLTQKLANSEQQTARKSSNTQQIDQLQQENKELLELNGKYESQLTTLSTIKTELCSRINKFQITTKELEIQLNQIRYARESAQEEKYILTKRLEDQNSKHTNQLEEMRRKMHETDMLTILLKRQKLQAVEKADIHKTNADSLNQKIILLEQQVTQLKSEIKMVTSQNTDVALEKEQSQGLLNSVEQQRQRLQQQLQTAKLQIQDQTEINRYKMKQYTSLLKQILKGLSIPTQEFQQVTSFEELLEFGSKQVLQLRKKQRDEESNRRRNNKREGDNDDSQGNSLHASPDLSNIKVQLFQQKPKQEDNLLLEQSPDNNNVQKQKNKESQEKAQDKQEQLQIDEFSQMREDGNESVASQDNRHNLDEFGDFASQKMNQSMISKDEQNIVKQSSEKQEQDGNNLSDFKDMGQSNVNDSMISATEEEVKQINNQKVYEQRSEIIKGQRQQVIKEQRQQIIERQNDKTDQPLQMSYKPQIIEEVQNIHQLQGQLSNFIQDNASKFNQSQIDRKQQFNISGPPVDTLSKSQNSASVQSGTNLKEFLEISSENNQSVVSKSQVKLSKGSHQQIGQIKPMQKMQSLQEAKSQSLQGSAAGFDEFNNMSENKVDSSLVSEHGLSQFGDLPRDELTGSIATIKKSSNQSLGLSQFGQIKQDQMNQSIVSEKSVEPLEKEDALKQRNNQDEHGMEEFGQIQNDQINQSINSEHGMSQFGDIKDQNNQSVISEGGIQDPQARAEEEEKEEIKPEGKQQIKPEGKEQIKVEKENQQMKEHGMDEFGDIKNEEINQSVTSQKQHGMEQFGQLNEMNNESILSKKSELGLSQFGELDNNLGDSSMISEQEIKVGNVLDQNGQVVEKEVKGSGFDEFDDLNNDRMRDSLASQTDSKQG